MEFSKRICKPKDIIFVVCLAILVLAKAEEFQGVTYQTAYRTVFRMQIHADLVSGCCPGWDKRSPRDVGCLKPVCNEDCENGGQCVGPGLCVCAEGYTGYKCQIDIDECSGRNMCQQKCTNMVGSYECSCQEGFRLANDEFTCELCLNCTKEFKLLQARIETYQANNTQDETLQEIRKQIQNLTEVKAQADSINKIQKQIDVLKDTTIKDEKYKQLQNKINSLQNKIKEVDAIKVLNKKFESLKESSLQKEQFKEVQNEIEDLQEMKTQIDSIKVLNATIMRLQEDDTQAKKLHDLQQQIDGIFENKAQQDRAHVDMFEEMRKDIEQLRGIKKDVDVVKDIKSQLDRMGNRIQELESDKAVLKKELTEAKTQYEAFQAKEARVEYTTTDPYEVDRQPLLERLASLSEQISILEERMADCACNQDYPRG